MYRKWDSTEYFDLFAAEDMDSGELCMFAPECSRKTEENLKFTQSIDNDHIKISVRRAGIRTEFESAALVFLVHHCREIYLVEWVDTFFIHPECHRNRFQEQKLLQRDKEIDEFPQAHTVKYFFHRGDAYLVAYCRVKSDTAADRKMAFAPLDGDDRDIHGSDVFSFEDAVQCLVRVLWELHAAAEIIPGSCRDITKINTGQILNTGKNLLDRTVTADCDQINRMFR